MDDSQDSDVFPENSPDFTCSSSSVMDVDSYESLISRTKDALSRNLQQEIEKPTFRPYLHAIIEDCGLCISQSLDLLIGLLEDVKVPIKDLCDHMEEAGNIMQMLSNFLSNILDLITMRCADMSLLPTTTGQIIMSVFEHCRDSESLYGNHLRSVETQMKDLFRACHELQVIYLMILEKHFVFELNVVKEQTVLLEALEINLKIGEIVQNLDVKTMAEQWKGYAMICEKYSEHLTEKNIYFNCTKMLCNVVESNIRNAMEKNQQDKILMRSMKVTTFTIKIIIRMLNIFKNSGQNQDHILELLINVYLHNAAYLENICDKPPQFIALITSSVTNPSESLLKDLLLDEEFVNCLLKHDVKNLATDKLLGYIILLCSIMKILMQSNDKLMMWKKNMISHIFDCIPYSSKISCMGLRFKSDINAETVGLYEHLLSNVFALAVTLKSEDFVLLERHMYESLLETDSWSAMFSSNLWILIARVSNTRLRLNQLICLCKTYQKLENNSLFKLSPQETHLNITLSQLFKYISDEDKVKIYIEYNLRDDRNVGLWTVLKVSSLPKIVRRKVEQMTKEKFKMKLEGLMKSGIQYTAEIYNLVNTIKLTSTCTFQDSDDILEQLLIQAWMKACPKCSKLAPEQLMRGTVWYLDFVEALVCLTSAMVPLFRVESMAMILHVITNGIEIGNIESKLTFTNLLCNPFLYQHVVGTSAETKLIQCLIKVCTTNDTLKHKLFSSINSSDKLIEKIFHRDAELHKCWKEYAKYQKRECNEQTDFKYVHKCMSSRDEAEIRYSGSIKDSNFDFADIDSLLAVESDLEPSAKKIKLDTNDADPIITRLENDVSLLSRGQENVFSEEHKDRIRNVCYQLQNMIN